MKATLEDYYFTTELKWIFSMVSIAASAYMFFMTSLSYFSLIPLLIPLIAFSTKYTLSIDLDDKSIRDDFYLLWAKTKSKKSSFSSLEKITIDKQNHTYTANSRGKSGVTNVNEYVGVLKYDASREYEISRSMNYQSFADDINYVAAKLDLEVERLF